MSERSSKQRYQVSADRHSASRRIRYVERGGNLSDDCTLCQLDTGALSHTTPTLPISPHNEYGVSMNLNIALLAELELLTRFPHDSALQGLKIHSDATHEHIQAAERLYNKGLTTQVDGGYLTSSGHQAAQHAQALLTLLNPDN